LYGRYKADQYGGGNPWQLITAALASLFYQAAQACPSSSACLTDKELHAWQAALGKTASAGAGAGAGDASFTGTRSAFVAAGDAVLNRLVHHIVVPANSDVHVYEQIDKSSGDQYNAQDLTWSYAEILMALEERAKALKML
jgi:GH15 family glucan-1,4-alpha-glucosidase